MNQPKLPKKSQPLAIRRLDQMKALVHPLRYQIFERLIIDAASPKAVALAMGLKETRLYHHFRILEEAGLIKRVRSERKRGAVERSYAAVADRIIVDNARLGGELIPGGSIAQQALHATMQEVEAVENRARAERREPDLRVARLVLRLSPERAAELESKLDALLADAQRDHSGASATDYRMTLAMYQAAPSGGARETD